MAKYMALEDKEVLRQKAKEIFNGQLVIERYGVTGLDLGKAMGKFKMDMDSDEFARYILELGESEVWKAFESATGLVAKQY